MHIIALSPASASEPVIGVPSAFDTNIYSTHKQTLTHTRTHIRVLGNKHIPSS